MRVVANLTPKQRRAVECLADGLSRADAARKLGVSRKRVANLWNEARARLLAAMPEADRIATKMMQRPPRRVRAMQLSAIPSALF